MLLLLLLLLLRCIDEQLCLWATSDWLDGRGVVGVLWLAQVERTEADPSAVILAVATPEDWDAVQEAVAATGFLDVFGAQVSVDT
eukprot:COSAG01_NODE_1265_length_10990_cov_23.579745_12_plen_85_part_00